MKTFAALIAAGIAASASAQTEMVVCVEEISAGSWTITGELLNPTGTIRAVISDLNFTLVGTGISGFAYNPAFDSTFFGPASSVVTPTSINFGGTNTLPPLNNPGGPDSSNPLNVGSFSATSVASLTINGQFSGAYVQAPFDNVFFYQTAQGTAGTVPFRVEIKPIPAPASAALLGLGGLAAIRRRR